MIIVNFIAHDDDDDNNENNASCQPRPGPQSRFFAMHPTGMRQGQDVVEGRRSSQVNLEVHQIYT